MTTLSKDEVVRLAREAGMPVTDYGSGPFIDDGVTTMHIEKLYTLCRADLVAENERLKSGESMLKWVELLAERDAFKADAERLDWLQKTRGTVSVCNHIEYEPRTDGSNLRNEIQVFDGWCVDIDLDAVMDVRATIDAAMKRGDA